MTGTKFHCSQENCTISKSGALFPGPGPCPVCGHALVGSRQPEDNIERRHRADALIDQLPFPVAYPWYMARNKDLEPLMRVNNMIFTAYQAMRVTSLLLLSEYMETEESCLSLGRHLTRMHMPHWGEWKGLTFALAKYIAGKNPRYVPSCHYFFASLAENWRSMGRAWKKDPAADPFRQGRQVPLPIEIFQVLRNRRAHNLGVLDGTGDEREILAGHLPVLEFLLTRLFADEDIHLLRLPIADTPEAGRCQKLLADDKTRSIPLIPLEGIHADLGFTLHDHSLDANLRQALQKSPLVVRKENNVLPVYPFFLALDREAADSGGIIEPVTLVDGFSQKRFVYLGVKSHGMVPGLGKKVVEMLARKQHVLGLSRNQCSRDLMVAWTRDNSATTLANLTMSKYFPQCYLERGVDQAFGRAINRGRRAIVLAGEAGCGKSSLLCRFVEHLLKRQKEPDPEKESRTGTSGDAPDLLLQARPDRDMVIFMSGRQDIQADAAESMEHAFCRALLKCCGVRENEFNTPLDFIRHLDSHGRSSDGNAEPAMWLILDAINEVDRFLDFGRMLDTFISKTSCYPWLRIICSLRAGALAGLQEREKKNNIHGPLPFTSDQVYHLFINRYSQGDKKEPFLLLPAFTGDETGRAYALRQQNLPEQAALNPFASLPVDLQAMLASPLYLHIFHETWKGRQAKPAALTSRATLVEAYLDSLQRDLPAIGDTLEAIGDYLYSHETPFWSEEEAWNWTSRWFERQYDPAARVCSLSPVESLVSASLLMRPTDDARAYQFSHQKLCEQVLHRTLVRQWQQLGIAAASEAELSSGKRGKILALFRTWLEKGERFDWLANAAAGLFCSWLDTDKSWLLALLPGLEGKIDSSLTTVCRAVFLRMADLEKPDQPFIEAGFQPSARYDPFIRALFAAYLAAGTTGASLGMTKILAAAIPGHESLVALEPERIDFRRVLSVSYISMGRMYQAQGRGDEALEHYAKSLEIMESLVAMEPERTDFRRDLSISYNNMGRMYQAQGRGDEALEYYAKDLEIMESLVALEPERTDFRRELSVSYTNMGHMYQAQGRGDEALEYYAKGLEIMESLVAMEPERTDFRRVLSVSYNSMGNMYKAQGRGDEALEYYAKGLEIMESLVAMEPERTDFRRELSVSYTLLGNMYKAQGRGDEALEYYTKGLEIMESLVALEPERTDFRRDLSVSYNNMGDMYKAQGRGDEALEYYAKDLEIMESLVALEPERTDFQVDLAISHWYMYLVCPGEEKYHWLTRAMDILKPLRDQGMAHSQLDQLYDLVNKALDKLEGGANVT